MNNPPSRHLGAPAQYHVSELHTYHQNPREGDVEAIKASMQVNGVYKPLVINAGTHTGRKLEVLAGNHSLKAMRELAEENPDDPRWQQVDVWVVDVDNDAAARIVLADNRTSDIGGYDDSQLLELLDSLGGDLEGTGYLEDDLDILRELNEAAPSLDDLEEEYGEPQDDDLNVWIRIHAAPPLVEQWDNFSRGFDDPAEALEHLLDHGPVE